MLIVDLSAEAANGTTTSVEGMNKMSFRRLTACVAIRYAAVLSLLVSCGCTAFKTGSPIAAVQSTNFPSIHITSKQNVLKVGDTLRIHLCLSNNLNVPLVTKGPPALYSGLKVFNSTTGEEIIGNLFCVSHSSSGTPDPLIRLKPGKSICRNIEYEWQKLQTIDPPLSNYGETTKQLVRVNHGAPLNYLVDGMRRFFLKPGNYKITITWSGLSDDCVEVDGKRINVPEYFGKAKLAEIESNPIQIVVKP